MSVENNGHEQFLSMGSPTLTFGRVSFAPSRFDHFSPISTPKGHIGPKLCCRQDVTAHFLVREPYV